MTFYDTSPIFKEIFGNQTFEDFVDFERKFAAFQEQTGAIFRIKSSVSVGAENKKRSVKIDEKFKYGGVTYICVRHGINKSPKFYPYSSAKINSRGASCNCKAYISLSYKTAIQKLYVTSTNPKHNHPLPIKNPKVIVIQEPPKSPSPLEDHHSEIEDSTMIKSDSNVNRDPGNFKMKAGDELPYPQNSKMLKSNSSIPTPSHTNQINYYPAHSAPHNKYSNHPNLYTPSPQTQTSHLHSSTHNNQNIFQNINLGSGSMNNFGPLNKLPNANNSSANGTNLTKLNPSNSTGANHSTPSKYSQLLAVIEDMGRDIRPAYSGSKVAAERLKRGIVHSRILVRECLLEAEKCART